MSFLQCIFFSLHTIFDTIITNHSYNWCPKQQLVFRVFSIIAFFFLITSSSSPHFDSFANEERSTDLTLVASSRINRSTAVVVDYHLNKEFGYKWCGGEEWGNEGGWMFLGWFVTHMMSINISWIRLIKQEKRKRYDGRRRGTKILCMFRDDSMISHRRTFKHKGLEEKSRNRKFLLLSFILLSSSFFILVISTSRNIIN